MFLQDKFDDFLAGRFNEPLATAGFLLSLAAWFVFALSQVAR
jgi:hypothetical protein